MSKKDKYSITYDGTVYNMSLPLKKIMERLISIGKNAVELASQVLVLNDKLHGAEDQIAMANIELARYKKLVQEKLEIVRKKDEDIRKLKAVISPKMLEVYKKQSWFDASKLLIEEAGVLNKWIEETAK